MTNRDHQEEINRCNINGELFHQVLSGIVPKGHVSSYGSLHRIEMPSGDWLIVVHDLGNGYFDLRGSTPDNQEFAYENLTQEKVEGWLKIKYEDEVTPKTPNSEKAAEREREINQDPEIDSLAQINEYSSQDQIDVMNQRLTGHSLPFLADHLGSLLQCRTCTIIGSQIRIECDIVSIIVSITETKKHNVEVYLDGEHQVSKDGLDSAQLYKYLFDLTNGVMEKKADHDRRLATDWDEGEFSHSDAFETLKELSQELGNPNDVVRNRSLFDLRGLVTKKTISDPIDRQETLLEAMDRKLVNNATETHVRGDRTHKGMPVSLNEHRDASTPYQSKSDKVLHYSMEHGAILVDRDQVPEKLKLNYDFDNGVVLTPESAPNQMPSRYYSRFHRG